MGVLGLLWPKDPRQVQEPEACLKCHSGVVVCEQLRPKLSQTTTKSKRHFWWVFPLEYSDNQFQWVVFPHQTILQHQLGVYNSAQLWNYIPGDSIRSYSLWTQSQKTAPPLSFRPQSQVWVVTCASDPLTINGQFQQAPIWVQLIFWSLSHNLEKHFTY